MLTYPCQLTDYSTDQPWLSHWPGFDGIRRAKCWLLALVHSADYTLLHLSNGHVSMQKQLRPETTGWQRCVKSVSPVGISF
jgi:hypothetical protein